MLTLIKSVEHACAAAELVQRKHAHIQRTTVCVSLFPLALDRERSAQDMDRWSIVGAHPYREQVQQDVCLNRVHRGQSGATPVMRRFRLLALFGVTGCVSLDNGV